MNNSNNIKCQCFKNDESKQKNNKKTKKNELKFSNKLNKLFVDKKTNKIVKLKLFESNKNSTIN